LPVSDGQDAMTGTRAAAKHVVDEVIGHGDGVVSVVDEHPHEVG